MDDMFPRNVLLQYVESAPEGEYQRAARWTPQCLSLSSLADAPRKDFTDEESQHLSALCQYCINGLALAFRSRCPRKEVMKRYRDGHLEVSVAEAIKLHLARDGCKRCRTTPERAVKTSDADFWARAISAAAKTLHTLPAELVGGGTKFAFEFLKSSSPQVVPRVLTVAPPAAVRGGESKAVRGRKVRVDPGMKSVKVTLSGSGDLPARLVLVSADTKLPPQEATGTPTASGREYRFLNVDPGRYLVLTPHE